MNDSMLLSPHSMRCPICCSEKGFINTKAHIVEGIIYVCEECAGYFLFPPMHVEYTDSQWTKSRKEKWENDTQIACTMAPALCKSIEPYLGRPIRSILEIGCGSGFMSTGFSSCGCDYVGIDVDSKLIEFAKNKGIDAHCLSAEDVGQDTLPHAKYELIIAANVFEHLNEPYEALQNLRGICGGIILIIVPNPKGLYHMLAANTTVRKLIQLVKGTKRKSAYSIDGYWHNIAYSAQTLSYLCDKAGLEPLKIGPIGTNDPIFGFVQPNTSVKYKLASGIAGLLGMDCQIVLIAAPKSL